MKVRTDEEIPHPEKCRRLFAAIDALAEAADKLADDHTKIGATGNLRKNAAIEFAKASKRLNR